MTDKGANILESLKKLSKILEKAGSLTPLFTTDLKYGFLYRIISYSAI